MEIILKSNHSILFKLCDLLTNWYLLLWRGFFFWLRCQSFKWKHPHCSSKLILVTCPTYYIFLLDINYMYFYLECFWDMFSLWGHSILPAGYNIFSWYVAHISVERWFSGSTYAPVLPVCETLCHPLWMFTGTLLDLQSNLTFIQISYPHLWHRHRVNQVLSPCSV